VKTLCGIVVLLVVLAFGMSGACNCGGDNWERVAECSTGPAWKIEGDLICDDHAQTTFAARDWEPGDNAITACEFCESRAVGTNNDGGQGQ
jgi:hypothetical protein